MQRVLSERLRQIDSFSTPISLKFNGKYKFKTIWGGVLTIVTVIMLLVYLYFLITSPMKLTLIAKSGKTFYPFLESVANVWVLNNKIASKNSTTSVNEEVSTNNTNTIPEGETVTTNGTIDWSATLGNKKFEKSKERIGNTTSHNLHNGGMGVAFCFRNGFDSKYYFVSNQKHTYSGYSKGE